MQKQITLTSTCKPNCTSSYIPAHRPQPPQSTMIILCTVAHTSTVWCTARPYSRSKTYSNRIACQSIALTTEVNNVVRFRNTAPFSGSVGLSQVTSEEKNVILYTRRMVCRISYTFFAICASSSIWTRAETLRVGCKRSWALNHTSFLVVEVATLVTVISMAPHETFITLWMTCCSKIGTLLDQFHLHESFFWWVY